MKLEVLSETPSRLSARLTGVTTGTVNALRRAIVSQLPSFAVEDVDFYENNSVMFNEYIAHRIGLVPLTFEDGVAPETKIQFSLSAEGPGTVLSRDLKTQDEKIKVFDEEVPLIKLNDKQKIRLEATAIQGVGKTHAKFQCAIASYDAVVNVKGLKPSGKAPFTLSSLEAMKDATQVEILPGEFIFHVESYNNVTAREHLLRAIKMIEAETKEFKKAI